MAKAKTAEELQKAADEAAEQSVKDMAALQATVKAQAEHGDKLLKGMQALAGVVKGQKDAIDKMSGSFTELSQRAAVAPAKGGNSGTSDQDVESLSRKEFLSDVILPQLGGMLDEKLKGISDRLDGVSSDFETKSVRDEVALMRGNRKDFDQWGTEVTKELKKNPSLTVEDAYLLARTRDPDKAKKIDDDIETKEKEAAAKAAEQGGNFGGMRPSGGGEVEERDDMEQDEAADKAWEDVEESLGGKAEMDKALGTDLL